MIKQCTSAFNSSWDTRISTYLGYKLVQNRLCQSSIDALDLFSMKPFRAGKFEAKDMVALSGALKHGVH